MNNENTAADHGPTLHNGDEAFDDGFRPVEPAPRPYFLHVVDGQKATLAVNVFRPNLSYTFTHSRALQGGHGPSAVADKLGRKTTGFLALASPSPASKHGQRPHLSPGRQTVLAWAESGHDFGKRGDMVDAGAGSHALANKVWTRRVIRLAAVLNMGMNRPFDSMGEAQRRDGLDGVFQASHVEVKLAAHAIHLLLHLFSPPADDATGDDDAWVAAMRGRLKALRRARWSDGSRPAFDVVVSRRNCVLCRLFVARLSHLTGVEINIVCGQQLVPAVHKQPVMARKTGEGEGEGGDGFDWGEQDTDDQDDDDDDDETKDEEKTDDAAQMPVADAPAPAPFTPPKQTATDDDAGSPLGLPRHPRGIAKPLPATPETQPPSWMVRK